ncbi:hypothetical protein PM03_05890 [Thalassobacter stenotrophicus]|nr:hypothetical protein PM03_05890 [Thalassobacter stenotrophicus]KGL01310.1 hypothetical protein PM04_10695 [Thalassobacter sp. 16PALIMAR09]
MPSPLVVRAISSAGTPRFLRWCDIYDQVSELVYNFTTLFREKRTFGGIPHKNKGTPVAL